MIRIYGHDLSVQTQRLHLATIDTITASRAGVFIDDHLKVREGQHRLDIVLSQHLQETAAAPATVTDENKTSQIVVGVVNQARFFRSFQDLQALLFGDPFTKSAIHDEIRHLPETQA